MPCPWFLSGDLEVLDYDYDTITINDHREWFEMDFIGTRNEMQINKTILSLD